MSTTNPARPQRIKNLFAEHPIWVVGTLLFAGMTLLIGHMSGLNTELVQASSLEDARLYTEALREFRSVYTSEVVARVHGEGITVSHDYRERERAIPLPATLSMLLGQRIAAAGSGGDVRLYSDYPFPWRAKTRRPLDAFETEALPFLREHPDQAFYRFEDNAGVPVLRYATADLMRPECVSCHNSHPDTPRKGWKVGDVRGVLSVTRPVQHVLQKTRSHLWETWAVMAAILFLTLVGVALALRSFRAKVLAEEANQVKTAFLIKMSHEVRTPMNGVIGMTDLLHRTALSEQQRRYVETLRHSGESLINVIDDVLDLSKLEAGETRLESLEFGVRDLVEEVVALMSCTAMDKDVAYGCLIDPAIPAVVKGDPSRLRQVLTNFLSNAIKFTEVGEISVRAELAQRGQGSVRIRFQVQDTGIGIAPEAYPRVFTPFAQATDSHARRFGGSGLGMGISKALVELMDGEVGFESIPGEGSMFWFEIPILTSAEPVDPPDAPSFLRGVRLLLVARDNIHREVITAYAMTFDVPLVAMSETSEALEALQRPAENGLHTILLVELPLPQGKMAAFARAVAKLPLPRPVPLIVLSTGASHVANTDVFQRLLLPLRRSALHNALSVARQAPPQDVASPTARRVSASVDRGVRALIAEDNEINRRVAVGILTKMGVNCDVATNGFEVVEAWRHGDYDIVFMDCQMPECDGYEATRAIRRDEAEDAHIPIVAMTAHALSEAKDLALASGMDDYVSKPITFERLEEILARWT